VIDLIVLLGLAVIVVAVFGRRRLPRLGRGLGGGKHEFKRARQGLPPADPHLREEDDRPD
jgi:TatA/E family protein of Tat protein translocase